MLPIEIRDLTSGYGGYAALENVNLELREDDFLAIIGPNGGGKTTLFKTVLGLITPISGSVSIFGEPPSLGARKIGYVPQNEKFDSDYPIRTEDVVLMGLRSHKGLRPFYSPEEKEMADMAMDYAEVSDFRKKRISNLSGGQLQRVFLARALAPRPRILMLDEPTASLDPSMKDCTYDILRKANHDGVAVMVITHDMSSISHDVKRVACMNRRLVCSDTPQITEEMVALGFHCPPEFLRTSGGCCHD
jgi:zinc transport system ATP-binding protein